jgi:pyruvate,water dikinase
MGFFRNLINQLSFKGKEKPEADIEALRLGFQIRYQRFKRLIDANNSALEATSDIERALMGDIPFDMGFIQSKCTAIAVNVYIMVENLKLLAPRKYDNLTDVYNQIHRKIDSTLSPVRVITDERLVIFLNEIDRSMSEVVGNKMANLGELKTRVKLIVPNGFAITSHAQDLFFKHNRLGERIDNRLHQMEKGDITDRYTENAAVQQMIIEAELPPELSNAIVKAWQQIEDEVGSSIMVALRSSSLGEDAHGHSFAGQYRSELNISVDSILNAYKEVIASKYSLPAMSYRWKKGIKDADALMCVGCVVMVDAVSGGVTYSQNPLDKQDDSISINAAWGLPKAVVDGSIDCDLFVISRKRPLQVFSKDITLKCRKFVCYKKEGVCRIDLTDENQDVPSITDNQAIQLAEIAIQIETHYGYPQDIEWAIDDQGTIYLLQCRPLQQKEVIEKTGSDGFQEHFSTIIANGRITASPGAAVGNVFFVKKKADMLQFPEGAILVVSEALPSWASLLNRAAGVISEHGSFAGHLANVAREFEIPALFGFSDLNQILTNEDLITLDAGSRAIHRGRIEDSLIRKKSKLHPMEGTPVYNTLKEVSEYIVPLNLYDPDASDFNPNNCKSFHDITRFIHDRSVRHMFHHERENRPPEKATKQLFYKVPMKWWIINLDDGFKHDEKGKYVTLDNIRSIPMLAFWDGFVAVPWDGPPTLDGKGFMSVMSRSHPGTALTSGLRSRFIDQNYFMIAKNFCHLNSRLGYHFSMLEALLSERKEENYVKFHFRGGAAGYERRVRRISFIGELLREYGFWVEIKEDSLFARMEGYEMDVLQKRVIILGYLSLHTRQIDMIMKNRQAVQYYREKLVKDMDWLMNKKDEF